MKQSRRNVTNEKIAKLQGVDMSLMLTLAPQLNAMAGELTDDAPDEVWLSLESMIRAMKQARNMKKESGHRLRESYVVRVRPDETSAFVLGGLAWIRIDYADSEYGHTRMLDLDYWLSAAVPQVDDRPHGRVVATELTKQAIMIAHKPHEPYMEYIPPTLIGANLGNDPARHRARELATDGLLAPLYVARFGLTHAMPVIRPHLS